jgi:hypothetical protein
VLFVGLDWAEDHHDVVVMDDLGGVAARQRVPEGLAGLRLVHELLAGHVEDPAEVVVGTETDRGLFVGRWWRPATRCMRSTRWPSAATATAMPPRGPIRCCRCQGPGRPGPDRPAQPPPGRRRQRAGRGGQGPGPDPPESGLDPPAPAEPAAQPVAGVLPGGAGRRRWRPGRPRRLGRAPGGADPTLGRQLSRAKLAATLRRAGRQRGVDGRAAELQAVLRQPQLEPSPVVAEAYGAAVTALVGVIGVLTSQLEQVAEQLQRHFDQHPTPRSRVVCPDSV